MPSGNFKKRGRSYLRLFQFLFGVESKKIGLKKMGGSSQKNVFLVEICHFDQKVGFWPIYSQKFKYLAPWVNFSADFSIAKILFLNKIYCQPGSMSKRIGILSQNRQFCLGLEIFLKFMTKNALSLTEHGSWLPKHFV